MNTEVKTYHPDNPLKAIRPEGLIGTKRMYRWLEQMLDRRTDCLPDLRAYNGMTKAIATLMRSIRDTEIFNYRIKTKWEMLRDPDWRGRVFRELGGEKALGRWEARKAKAAQTVWTPRERTVPDTPPAPDRSERKPGRRFVTDSQGQFRLAPITIERPSWVTPEPRNRSGEYRGPREITLPDLNNIKFPIIPLEAFELRRTHTPPVIPAKRSAETPPYHLATKITSKNPDHALTGSRMCGAKRLLRDDSVGKPSRTKQLALGTASDYVIDTSAPPPGAVLKISWPGFGPRPKSKDPD